MQLTVVIPIYNAAAYLAETIESIIKQNSNNYNVLLVNDGSTDESAEICEKYAKDYKIVSVIHKENGGVSSARNCGIKRASGNYIWLVDSDDLVTPNSINRIVSALEYYKPDILLSHLLLFDNRSSNEIVGDTYDIDFISNCKKDEFILYYMQNYGIITHVGSHIYRKEFLVESGSWFNENLSFYEDEDWLIGIILVCSKFGALNEVIYQYRKDNDNSITHRKMNLIRFKCAYEVFVKWFFFFKNQYGNKKENETVLRYFSNYYKRLLHYIIEMPSSERREALRMYRQNIDIADYC